jgi:hypothetical protein
MTSPFASPTWHPGATPSSDAGWLVLLAGCTGLILLVLFAAAATVILNLRETALRGAETTQRHLSLVLAEQADRSLQALGAVLGGVIQMLPAQGAVDAASYGRVATVEAVHMQLEHQVSGMPYVNAITLIDAHGNLLNFSRRWPIPKLNVADSDYFHAMQADPTRQRFLSVPVNNSDDGAPIVYLARRVQTIDGRFAGLALATIELRYFEDLYRSVTAGPRPHRWRGKAYVPRTE